MIGESSPKLEEGLEEEETRRRDEISTGERKHPMPELEDPLPRHKKLELELTPPSQRGRSLVVPILPPDGETPTEEDASLGEAESATPHRR